MTKEADVLTEDCRLALPDGYTYDQTDGTREKEVRQLARDVFGKKRADHFAYRLSGSREVAAIAVRDDEYDLVGYGRLHYWSYHAFGIVGPRRLKGMLDFLMVHPDHHNRGIGSVIVSERLRLASVAGVGSIAISGLEPTNTLWEKYVSEWGFRQRADGSLRRVGG